jgi:hypothetical protein
MRSLLVYSKKWRKPSRGHWQAYFHRSLGINRSKGMNRLEYTWWPPWWPPDDPLMTPWWPPDDPSPPGPNTNELQFLYENIWNLDFRPPVDKKNHETKSEKKFQFVGPCTDPRSGQIYYSKQVRLGKSSLPLILSCLARHDLKIFKRWN